MTYPARVLAVREDGEIEALDSDQFSMLSDTEFTVGVGGVAVRDTVYLSSAMTVDKTEGTIATTPCIGFVAALLPLGKCLVRREGPLKGFLALNPGKIYYVDPGNFGGITDIPPEGPGEITQEVGFAIAADVLQIFIDMDFTQ
jgi:hypothetical protein